MIQRMTDDEYAEARDSADAPVCPFCRGSNIAVTVPLRWDEPDRTTGLATERFRCEGCERRWTEILRPIAYEHAGA